MRHLVPHVLGVFAWVWVGLFAFPSEVMAQSVQSVSARVATLEQQMSAVQTAVAALTAQDATQTSQIAALQAGAATQAGQIALQAGYIATQAGQIAALQAGVVPVGTIIAYSAETPPPGYVECDGTPLARATYPALFAAIGTAFGAGDGSSTFNIPDLRGQFLRGWSHGTGRDPDAAQRYLFFVGGATGDHVGSYQFDAVQSLAFFSGALNPFGPFEVVAGGNSIGGNIVHLSNGNETRPKNNAVMYAIKY